MYNYRKESNSKSDKERREALYRFLLSRGEKWTSMEQTTDTISLYPAFFTTKYHDSSARRLLTADIAAINVSPDYQKVIVSGTQGIKLANEDEFYKFIGTELKEIFDKLRRTRAIIKKGKRDQQIDFEGKIAEAFLVKEEDNG